MLALLLLVAQANLTNVVTLDAALAAAREHQPQLRQARAQTDIMRARADEARSALLPQLSGVASWSRSTANVVPRPSQIAIDTPSVAPTFDSRNSFNFGLTVSQQIYDSQQTIDKYRAARVTIESQAQAELYAALSVELGVRTAFFAARARKSLVDLAKETLANQERHLSQVEGFVRVGSRPEIDLAQARTDRANARVALIRAENDYAAARAQLNLSMGIEGATDYDVADETLPPVDVESRDTDTLFDEARHARPDLTAIERQIAAQELTVRSTLGGYGPSLSANMSITDGGVDITDLKWNLSAGLSLNWQLFSGLLTFSAVKEQRAQLASLRAQLDGARQQVRLDVDQARLAVRAAQGSIVAAGEAVENARERLRLAEGRYAAGVGNAIELGDAQLSRSTTAAQKVQSDYDLASARAQLLRALGRRDLRRQ